MERSFAAETILVTGGIHSRFIYKSTRKHQENKENCDKCYKNNTKWGFLAGDSEGVACVERMESIEADAATKAAPPKLRP